VVKVMIAARSKTVVFVAILALTTFGALRTASAQPADIIAVNKAFQDHHARGNYPAAQIDAQQLERLAKARFGADHPYYAVALNKLGIVFWAQDKYTEAEGLLKRALAIREKVLGASHPTVGESLNNLALVYRAQRKYGDPQQPRPRVSRQGKYVDAEALLRPALVIREQALGTAHPLVALILVGTVGVARRGQNAPAESPESLRGIAIPGIAGVIARSSGDGCAALRQAPT